MDNNKGKFEITEMFMAQACRNRRFFGTITRGTDVNGHPVVRGRITVNNGFVCSQAATQEELGKWLDELVKMVLDMCLHHSGGAMVEINSSTCFLN